MSSQQFKVGDVLRSSDHRNLACPWVRVLAVAERGVQVQRYRDSELSEPVGRPVWIPRPAAEQMYPVTVNHQTENVPR